MALSVEMKLLHEHRIGDTVDPLKDVFGVWISGHPSCALGKDRRIAFTGEKGPNSGNVCFINQHMLEPSEMEEVVKQVSAWQADAEAISLSRTTEKREKAL